VSELSNLVTDLVAANRILANEGIVDAFGHISVRHPENPNRYLLSRSRSPGLVTEDDIMEFELDGTLVGAAKDTPIYIERPIHGAVYEARPDVQSVVHHHCLEMLPFAITKLPMRPALHTSRSIGAEVPVWDIKEKFGDTDLLVTTMEQGRDMSRILAANKAVIMRGHGATVTGLTIPQAVSVSIAMQRNAIAVLEALKVGEVTYLTKGEIEFQNPGSASLRGHDRQWEYLCDRAGVKSS
jgi:ribulose-5-phosphate 4-epimerase/fuculose-1-phosphate aldolase